MEFLFLVLLTIFIILSFILIGLIYYEYKELKSYNEKFTLLASALSDVAEVVNQNADAAKQETVLLRENTLEIALIKQILDIHARALAYTLPNKEWEDVVVALKKSYKEE